MRFQHIVTSVVRKQVVLVAVLASVATLAGGCRLAPPAGTSHSPSGALDAATSPVHPAFQCHITPGPPPTIRVQGWASDWDTTDPIQVMLVFRSGFTTVAGDHGEWTDTFGPVLADAPRPDVDAAYGRGADFGFDVSFPGSWCTGLVCAIALNVGPGEDSLLGCRGVRQTA